MKAKRKFTYEPDYAVPPGESIREQMEAYGWTQKELADRLDTTAQTLNRIFKGEQPITLETANRLELVLGAPARFWNNLEVNYRERISKLEERQRLQGDLSWLKTIPTAELIGRGVLTKTKDRVALLRETLAFYGVGSVSAWHKVWDRPAVAARRSACFETRPGAASAWIRLGELEAQKQDCQPYSRKKLIRGIAELRTLTRIDDPNAMAKQMRQICSGCGVALALVPEMKKVPWNGATQWLSPDKAMILLNLHGKGEDRFWFSFFHEVGHILNDSKKDLLINDGNHDDPREDRAEQFAADTLIPPQHNDQIRAAQSEADIKVIASELGVAPGIVAGRYQFLTHEWHRFNNLIRKFKWAAGGKGEEA